MKQCPYKLKAGKWAFRCTREPGHEDEHWLKVPKYLEGQE